MDEFASTIGWPGTFFRAWARQNIVQVGRKSAFRKMCRPNRGRDVRVATNHGFDMRVTIGDPVVNAIVAYGEFEPGLTRLITKLAPDASAFVDVGCNVGYFSCLYAAFGPSSRRILALDANPAMARTCRENLELQGRQNGASVINAAVSDREESLTLRCPRNRPSYASIGAVEDVDVEELAVRARPLPAMIDEAGIPAGGILKIDIEGYEVKLFQGLGDRLRHFRHLLFEYSPDNLRRCGHEPEDIWEGERWNGYHLHYLPADEGEPVAFAKPSEIPAGAEMIWAKQRE